MFGNVFYHESIRKVIVAFGTIFNDITVVRRLANGTEKERIKVPLAFGPKEKFLVRLRQDPNLDKEIAITLPRIGFDIVSYNYDSSRKLPTVNQNRISNGTDAASRQYNPVPWNIGINLYVMTSFQDDGLQIIEQIMPFFKPEWTVTINSIPSLNLKDDIPIVIGDMSQEDVYEGNFEERRAIIWTIPFTVKALMYGPVQTSGVIKEAQTDFLIAPGDGPVTDAEVAATPRSVRSVITPDPLTATSDDDFGFTVIIQKFEDNKKFNSTTLQDEDL